RKHKKVGIMERCDLLHARKNSDHMHTSRKVLAGDHAIELRAISVIIGSRDNQVGIGAFHLRKGLKQDIETLLVVEATEEEKVWAIDEFGMRIAEGSLIGKILELVKIKPVRLHDGGSPQL